MGRGSGIYGQKYGTFRSVTPELIFFSVKNFLNWQKLISKQQGEQDPYFDIKKISVQFLLD